MHFCNLENTELGCKWKGGGCDNYDTEMTEFDEAVEKMKKGIYEITCSSLGWSVCASIRYCTTLLVKVLYSLVSNVPRVPDQDYIMTIVLFSSHVFPYIECRDENYKDSPHNRSHLRIPFKDLPSLWSLDILLNILLFLQEKYPNTPGSQVT